MSENETIDTQSPIKEPAAKSGSGGRVLFLLVAGLVLVGGVLGMRYYLDSLVPKGEEQYRNKKRADNVKPADDEEETSIEILAGLFAGDKPSKEVEQLKEKKSDEVVYTYDQISKMDKGELTANIADLSKRLQKKRADLPPSFGAGSMGGGGGSEGDDKKEGDAALSVEALALPLEVMKQVLSKM